MTSARLRATGLSVLSLATVLAASSVSMAAGPRPRAATATPDADPASGPVVQWTREAGTPWSDYLLDVAVDTHGAITAVGSWGDGKPTSRGLVRSWDAAGAVRWEQVVAPGDHSHLAGVALDRSDGPIVAGDFGSVLQRQQVLVRAYTRGGSVRWSRSFGTPFDDTAADVATDAAGNIYVVGATKGALPGNHSAGWYDAWVRAYTPSGSVRWTRQFGTPHADAATSVVVSAAGDVFVGGQTYGSLDRPNQGKGDAFVRSYTAGGTLRWAHQYGNQQDEHVSALVIAPGGRLFVVGSTNGELKAARGTGLTFIKCLSLGGKVRWTRQDLGPARGAAWSPTLGLLVSGQEWLPDAAATGSAARAGSAATTGAVAGRHPRITNLHSEAYLRAYSLDGGSAWMRRVDSGGSDVFEGVAGGPGVAAIVVGSVEGPIADQPWQGGSDLVVRLYR